MARRAGGGGLAVELGETGMFDIVVDWKYLSSPADVGYASICMLGDLSRSIDVAIFFTT